jgi:hypothetical protein
VHAVGGGDNALDLEGYPFISTGKANYSPGLTALLSQQAAWQMLQLQAQVLQLLNQTNATVQPVLQLLNQTNATVQPVGYPSSALAAKPAGRMAFLLLGVAMLAI